MLEWKEKFKMKHKDTVNYPGGMTQLIEDVGDLKYDSLKAFLRLLAEKIERDGKKDSERERTQLAGNLFEASKALMLSSKHIGKAWKISKPYM